MVGNIHAGIGEFAGMGYRVDDMQTMQTIQSQLMMSRGSHTNNHTNQSHKQITQNDHARQDDVMSKNGNDE